MDKETAALHACACEACLSSYAAQPTCQDHLARDKDQQDNLGHLHSVYETWEQLWLILQAQHNLHM